MLNTINSGCVRRFPLRLRSITPPFLFIALNHDSLSLSLSLHFSLYFVHFDFIALFSFFSKQKNEHSTIFNGILFKYSIVFISTRFYSKRIVFIFTCAYIVHALRRSIYLLSTRFGNLKSKKYKYYLRECNRKMIVKERLFIRRVLVQGKGKLIKGKSINPWIHYSLYVNL